MIITVTVRDSTLVRPSEETPLKSLWISNIDLVAPNRYTLFAYFYRRPTAPDNNSFDPAVLRQALSRALVPFYPLAGRLKLDKDGRTEIHCNGKGVLFVVAESTAKFDDLGDFAPSAELRKLIPAVDYSASISSFPLLMLQVTFFKCGGVSVGVGTHHRVVDGFAAVHFINKWSDIARGGLGYVVKPFLDRTVMRARDPPRPQFPHIEYDQPGPTYVAETEHTTTAMFNITKEQLNILRRRLANEGCKLDKFSTYEVVAGHVWRCRCIASGLKGEQETKLYIATNGRPRLWPPQPEGYLGNMVFMATPMTTVRDLILSNKPTWYAASKIKEATRRMDNDYLRSSLDYLELLPDKSAVARRPELYKAPNLGITSWVRLPTEKADFGWGPPMYMGPLAVPYEGLAYLVRNPHNDDDGNLALAINLQTKHIKVFKNMFYYNLPLISAL